MNNYIVFKNISRAFGKNRVLRKLNFSLPNRGLIALLGPSGSGKSTILNILSGGDLEYEGECTIGRVCLKEMKQKERDHFRLSKIGYVFQDYSLLELETVFDNVMFPLHAVAKANPKTLKRRVNDLLGFVGLEDKAEQRVNTLSGGEKQRVCLARALANEPSLLLADEPTGALDEKNAKIVMDVLKRVSERRLVVLVSHDAELAKRYADKILHLNDGRLIEEVPPENEVEVGHFVETHLHEKKASSSLSLSFLFRHAWHLFKAKKGRSILTLSLIVMGVLGLGLSLYVSDSIGSELSATLGKMVSQNDIVMCPMKRVDQPIGRVYSGEENIAKDIVSRYADLGVDYGIGYLANYEEIFSDDNKFTVTKEGREVTLNSFSGRSLTEYAWLDPSATHYPETPQAMETDQIVLGLPYADMFNLCFDFGILRNYESLGNFLSRFYVTGTFYLSHREWAYEDTQLFRIIAVRESAVPLIYHSDHQWAEKIVEENMRFPVSYTMEGNEIRPWTLQKICYLSAKNLPALLGELRREKRYDDYVFVPTTREHHQTLCPIGEKCTLARAYIYHCDKTSVPYRFLEDVEMRHEGIVGRRVLTPGSYAAYSSLMVGTAQKFYVGVEEESLNKVIDAYSDVALEEKDEEYLLPDDVLDAGFLKASTEGISISNVLSDIQEGRKPLSSEECVLSKSLYEKWGRPKHLLAAGQVSEWESGKRVRRDFRLSRLEVVGVKNESRNILFVNADWTIDYFRDELGMSPFLLEPSGAIFTCASDKAAKRLLGELSKEYPNYRFSNPGAEIYDSISETMEYIELALFAFSSVALIISTLLYFITIVVSLRENENETRLLSVIGVSRADIVKARACQSFLLSMGSLGSGTLGMFLAEFVIHFYISRSFSASSPFVPAYRPFVAMSAFTLVSFLLSTAFLGLYVYASTQKVKKE